MCAITIEIDREALEAYLRNIAEKLPETISRILIEGADIIVEEAKARTPSRTGKLQTSINVIREHDKILVGPTEAYAPYVIQGTEPSPGRYVPAIQRRLITPTHPSFGTHPGIAPNQFLKEALEATKGSYPEFVSHEIKRPVLGAEKQLTYKTDYWNILNAVKIKVEEVTELKSVVLGEKSKIYDFPIAFIIPIRTPIEALSTGYIRHRVGFRIVVMTQGTEPEICQSNAIDIGCDTYDKILSDIKLGGKSDGIDPILFDPDYSIGETKTLSWVVLEFQAIKDRLEIL